MLSLSGLKHLRNRLRLLTQRCRHSAELASDSFEIVSDLSFEMNSDFSSPLDELQELAEEALVITCTVRGRSKHGDSADLDDTLERLKNLAIRLQGLHGDLENIALSTAATRGAISHMSKLAASMQENAALAQAIEESFTQASALQSKETIRMFQRKDDLEEWQPVTHGDFLNFSLVEKCRLLSEGLLKIELNEQQLSLPQALRYLKTFSEESSDSRFFAWCADQDITQDLQIILVDDDITTTELLRASLKNKIKTLEIYTCSDGAQALDLLTGDSECTYSNDLPTLMLLDLNMPKIGGIEVLEKLSEFPQSNKLAVFVLTGSLLGEHISKSYELGASGYIIKQNLHKHISYVVHLVNSFRSVPGE